jgi:glycosyltransferase involved in cell wall biosynthesis
VFVNVSQSEGVPLTIMEALSFGVPVVAPRVGGIPELLTANVGLFLPPQWTPSQVAQSLLELHSRSEAVKMQMRRDAVDRWRNFSNAAIVYDSFAKSLHDS